MTIYDFVNSINDSERIIYRIFNCNTDKLICNEYDDSDSFSVDEILDSKYADYEIGGTDVWYDNEAKAIFIEFNIDYDEEDGDFNEKV